MTTLKKLKYPIGSIRLFFNDTRLFIILMISFFLLILSVGKSIQAQTTTPGHTALEEAKGKEIWEKLQDKQTSCDTLSDEEFGALGEYYMGQMLGSSNAEGTGTSHEAMNTMMEQIHKSRPRGSRSTPLHSMFLEHFEIIKKSGAL